MNHQELPILETDLAGWTVPLFDFVENQVIACIPVYNEDQDTMERTINSFQKMEHGLRVQMVFVVDGCEDALPGLHAALGLGDHPKYVEANRYRYVRGEIPCLSE